MRLVRSATAAVAAASLLAIAPHSARDGVAAAVALPRATLLPAPTLTLPGSVDSNSPAMWDLEDGQRKLFVLTSHSGVPSRSAGSEIDRLGAPSEISLLPHPGYGVWFEAVVSDDVENVVRLLPQRMAGDAMRS